MISTIDKHHSNVSEGHMEL